MSNPTISDWHINRANGEIHIAQKEFEQAKKRIPNEYYDFLVLLDQNVRISSKELAITQEGYKLGMFSTEKGVYVTVSKPYVTVDGRIQMARDEHKAAKKKLDIHPPVIETIAGKPIMSVKVDSEIHGTATGTIEIGLANSKGVDVKNPFANAQTSAIGRALGYLGYGLVGTGIVATPDEMEDVLENTTVNNENHTEQEQPKSNAPQRFRVQVKELPQLNADGTSKITVLTEAKKIATLIMPKVFSNYTESLGVGQILIVNGWLNANGTLRVNHKMKPEIEMPGSSQASA